MKSLTKKILIIMLAAVMVFPFTAMAGEGTSDGSAVGGLLGSLAPEDSSLEDTLGNLVGSIVPEDFNLEEALGSIVPEDFNLEDALGSIVPEDFNLKDTLGSVVPEDFDLSATMAGLKDKLSGLTDKLSGLTGKAKDLLGSLLDSSGEEAQSEEAQDEETEEDLDWDLLFDYYDIHYREITDAISAFFQEETKEYLEPGDVFICSQNIAHEQSEEGFVRALGYFTVLNYDVQESDLVLKNAGSVTALLTLVLNEQGVIEVTDCQVAEDGETYTESLTSLCESLETTTDVFYSSMAFGDVMFFADLYNFLEEHPEYERIEYQGELMTFDDVNAALDKAVDELDF